MRGGGGMFERHRHGSEDDAPWPDPGMGRGRGRGFERSLSSGGPGGPGGGPGAGGVIGGTGAPVGGGEDPLLNGGAVSPRKGYTRAPFADWRKSSSAVANEDEWRSTGAPSGRRWNQVQIVGVL